MRKNRQVRKVVDLTIYTLRNISNAFARSPGPVAFKGSLDKLKNSRQLATCYGKIADSFLGFVGVACIRLWVRHLSARPNALAMGVASH